ncbi:MAG: hypothetical protein KAT10_05275, partial [Sulfurimonas sp.]|nr:hypothetical protein [Sulfurimonas sp.]
KVLSIQASDSSEIKSEITALKESKTAKLFRTKRPKTTPPKSDKSTFREYSAKAIARRDGRSESAVGSILGQSKFVC